MGEFRFDVRIPETATEVLNMLKRGSEKTGIKEGRLIVLYLANYAELTRGGLIPPLVSHAQPVSQNGFSPEPSTLIQEQNSPDVAAFYLDDED